MGSDTEDVGGTLLKEPALPAYRALKIAWMSGVASVVDPSRETASFHQRKHEVFLRMHDDQLAYRRIMGSADITEGATA